MDRFVSMKLFVAAVDAGSLAAAGRQFEMSPSMAGKYLNALESELNTRLLQRSTRRLSLTDAGRTYYERCQWILQAMNEADSEASDAQHEVRGTLRIAAPVTFGERYLSDALAAFLVDHPHVNIEIELDDRFVDLHARGIDVAIRIGRLPDSELVARRLTSCQMMMCASPAFLTREGTPRRIQDLRALPRLAFSEAQTLQGWRLSDKSGREHVVDGPLRIEANNMQVLLSSTLAGIGIAYGPTFVFGPDVQAGHLIQVLPQLRAPELTIHAVFLSGRYVPAKVHSFVDHLVALWGDVPPWDGVGP